MIYLFGNDMCCVFIVYATIFFKAVGDISMEMEELGEERIDNVDQLSEMINNVYVKWKFEIVCEMGGQFLELYFHISVTIC